MEIFMELEFILALRESVEACLVLAILLAYLDKRKDAASVRALFLGAGIGLVGGLGVAFALSAFLHSTELPGGGIFEGVFLLVAAGLVATLIYFSLGNHNSSAAIESRAHAAFSGKGAIGMGALAFASVFRESSELAFFLSASSMTSGPVSMLGVALGIVSGAVLVFLLYRLFSASKTLLFLKITSIFIVLFGAGLASGGITSLADAGAFNPGPVFWDLGKIVPLDSALGSLLHSIFGYEPAPSLAAVIMYFGYAFLAMHMLGRKSRRKPGT